MGGGAGRGSHAWERLLTLALLRPPPRPRYSAEAQALDHQCSCCKEGRTSQREVELSCPDGSSRKHRYTHIETCSCQDTVCGLPRAQRRAPSRERRASPRGLPLGRD